ncbi:MAG: DUF502 domain-containing protein [Nitrospiraceae bacterium]|nr:DUF502 domain-containing protein [Nitrospiraceae bacterium]
MKKLKNLLQKYFFTGLLVVVPVGATIFVLRLILGWIDRILGDLPSYVIGYKFPGLGIITLILIILIVGMVSANYFGNRIVRMWDRAMTHVPLVRGVYSTVKQVMETFSVKHNFSGVALVEYPRKGCYSIGFVTGKIDGQSLGFSGDHETVFVPTTPNPTAGFLLILPKSEVCHLDMTVEQGMKFIISLGLVSLSERQALRLKKGATGGGAA